MEARISGTTGLLGLIGSPVGHSGSPAMYNYSFKRLNLDYAYLAFDIKVEQLHKAIEAIKALDMRGCNVTMPCKTAVVEYLDELSPAAEMVGAVNTIVNEGGKLTGHITDGQGFIANLRAHGVDVVNRKIVVLGAGGAATAIQVQLALEGAESITIFNQQDEFFHNGEMTVKKIKNRLPNCHISLADLADKIKLKQSILEADLLINGTTVGMGNDSDTPVKDTSVFHSGLVVADAIYNPAVTRLLKDGAEKGCNVIGGKGMLLRQGAEAFKLYTGMEMPVEEVEAKYFS